MITPTTPVRSGVRDQHAVEDIYQETVLTAWKRLDTYQRNRPIGPWLRGIAGKTMLAYYRKTSRTDHPIDEEALRHLRQLMRPYQHFQTMSPRSFMINARVVIGRNHRHHHPQQDIRWGRDSTDEMGSITLLAIADNQDGEAPLRKSIRRHFINSLIFRKPSQLVEMLMQLDDNHDGSLQRSEASPRLKARSLSPLTPMIRASADPVSYVRRNWIGRSLDLRHAKIFAIPFGC